ncbi:MAG TPA: hypothetical protein VIP46_07195 [Pyrinomonadaceae bacterium]
MTSSPQSESIDKGIDSWVYYFKRMPPWPGGSDIFCAGSGDIIKAAAGFAAAIAQIRINKVTTLYPEILVILPAGLLLEESREELEARFYEQVAEFIFDNDPKVDITTLVDAAKTRIFLTIFDSYQTSTLVERISALSSGTAVFLADPYLYSSAPSNRTLNKPFLIPKPAGQGFNLGSKDAIWVQPLHQLGAKLTPIATEINIYICLFAQQYEPLTSEARQLLLSIDNCGVAFTSAPDEHKTSIRNVSRWIDLARSGDIPQLFKEIDEALESPFGRALIKAQSLTAAGRFTFAFSLIGPYVERILYKRDVKLSLLVSSIASRAGYHSVALTLLQAALENRLMGESELDASLQIAREVGATNEEMEIRRRLSKLYPQSLSVIRHKFSSCHSREDFISLAGELSSGFDLATSSEEVRYIHTLAANFASSENPNYRELINAVAFAYPAFKYQAVLDCASHALLLNNPVEAAKLCLDQEWDAANKEAASWSLLTCIQKFFLAKQASAPVDAEAIPTARPAEIEELAKESLIFILKHLASEPFDDELRAGLSQTLSPESAGLNGLIYLVGIIDSAPSAKTSSGTERIDVVEEASSDQQFIDFFKAVSPALKKPSILGRGHLPQLEQSYSYGDLLKVATDILIVEAGGRVSDEEDIKYLYILLHIALLLSKEVEADAEFDLIGIVTTGLCTSGAYQAARNLAEYCLQLAASSPSVLHKRQAWFRYSDVYLRCKNPLEALIGLGCAKQCADVEVSSNYLLQELILEIRTLRDLNLHEYALARFSRARELASLPGHTAEDLTRLEVMELGIRLDPIFRGRLKVNAEEQRAELEGIAKRLVEINREARDAADEILPTSVLIAQIHELQLSLGETPYAQLVTELEHSIRLVGERFANHLRALSQPHPTAESVESLGWALDGTRYEEDLGTDIVSATMLARRALAERDDPLAPDATLHLLEWLTNHSIRNTRTESHAEGPTDDDLDTALRRFTKLSLRRPDAAIHDDETASLYKLENELNARNRLQRRSIPTSTAGLADFAKQISAKSLDVQLMGIASDNSLIRVEAVAGRLSVKREPNSVFNPVTHRKWGVKYPFGYMSYATKDPFGRSEVVSSLEGMGVSVAKGDSPMLLISDSQLQDIPPNLLLIDGELAGEIRPMASAPSLLWLQSVLATERPQSGRRIAWIPTSIETVGPLQVLFESIAQTLDDHSFTINNEASIPEGIEGSDLTVIGAHGGLHPENEWFRVVSDDHVARHSPRSLARRLRGSGVVILFVCSGGRLDRHPFASATVGMIPLLLDHGCRAVIASPWPLDVSVGQYWLPAFLDSFKSGETVIKATYLANKHVAKTFSNHPMLALAMNVSGDPFVRWND